MQGFNLEGAAQYRAVGKSRSFDLTLGSITAEL